MDILTTGQQFGWKPYPIPLKHQKFVDEGIKLLENEGCISKSLSVLVAPIIIVPKKPDLTNPSKQQLHLMNVDFSSCLV